MNLRVREVGPEDRVRFDTFVAGHPTGNLLQSWAWGEFRAQRQWRAVRFLVEDDGGTGEVRGAASCLVRRLPTGGSVLYLPRGPVVDFLDRPALDTIARALRGVGRRERAVFAKIDPYVTPPTDEVLHALAGNGFRVGHRRGHFDGMQPRLCCILPLSGGSDHVLSSFRPKTRYNIRLADRRGVVVTRCDRRMLPVFYRLLEETCARNGFRERSYDYFEQMWDVMAAAGHAHLFVASHEGEHLAAAVLTTFGSKAVYLYGASSGARRSLMAPYAVQWAMIRFALERGCTSYDMTGIPKNLREGESGYGLWQFKRGFCGNHPAEFVGEYDLPLHPVLWRAWNVVEPHFWSARVAMERFGRRIREVGRRSNGGRVDPDARGGVTVPQS